MLKTDLEMYGTFPPAVEAFRRKFPEADSILAYYLPRQSPITPSLETLRAALPLLCCLLFFPSWAAAFLLLQNCINGVVHADSFPRFAELARKMPSVIFLKVDVDELKGFCEGAVGLEGFLQYLLKLDSRPIYEWRYWMRNYKGSNCSCSIGYCQR